MGTGTRDRIVAAGRELFARNGFGQVGLDQIVQQARLTKTTFYNHFESKEQLIREVLDLHEASIRETLFAAAQHVAGDDPRRTLLAVFDVLPEVHARDAYGWNLLISAAADYPNALDPIHQAVARNKRAMTLVLTDFARRAQAPEPEGLAAALSLLLHGAVLDRTLTGEDAQAFVHARHAAEMVINAAFA